MTSSTSELGAVHWRNAIRLSEEREAAATRPKTRLERRFAEGETRRELRRARRALDTTHRGRARTKLGVERRLAHLEAVRAAGAAGYDPREIPRWVIGQHTAIEDDRTGANLEKMIETLHPDVARKLRRACTGLEREHTMRSKRARQIGAFYFTLRSLAQATNRPGMAAQVEGFTRAMYACLSLNDESGEPYSVSALYHTSRSAERTAPDDCGPHEALRRAVDAADLLILARQPREENADARYLGVPRWIVRGGRRELFRPAFGVVWLYDPPD